MIKKLRSKFMLISMLSVVIVLGIMIGGINIINYRTTVDNADRVISVLSQNNGSFPERPFTETVPGGAPGGPADEITDQEGAGRPEPGEEMRRPGGPGAQALIESPELQYEARFFSVLLSQTGEVMNADTNRIAAVDEEEAQSLAEEIFASGKTRGFTSDYRYLRTEEGGNVRIIFYDCGRSLGYFRSFLRASLIISTAGAVLVFILIFFASGHIMKPVAESYEKQKRFITDAGHEIKTPLSIINADADVILMDGENSWAQDIKEQTARLTELTNNLIFLAKMEEGSPSITFEKCDFSKITEQTCESFSSMYLTGKRILRKNIMPDMYVKGDARALKELVTILLDNALKYSPEDGVTEVELSRSGKGVRLKVTNDTKEVLSEEDRQHLFDRFYRTDRSRNSDTGGYGIGLSTAHAIAEAHKGKISARSRDEGRLTIRVDLPAS